MVFSGLIQWISGPAQSRRQDEQKAAHSRLDDAREAWIASDRDAHLIHFRYASRRVLPSIVSQLSCSTFSHIFVAGVFVLTSLSSFFQRYRF